MYDFGRMDETCIGIYELVALGEATLPQKLALNVPSDTDLARAILLELLLDYGLRGTPARLARLSTDMVHLSISPFFLSLFFSKLLIRICSYRLMISK